MTRRRIALGLVSAWSCVASAHELRPAYLELRETQSETYDVLFKVAAGGASLRLALYPELPETCTRAQPPRSAFVDGAWIERWSVRCPGGLAGGTIAITGLSGTTTDALVRLSDLRGRSQVQRLTPDRPSFVVPAAPSPRRVALTYLRLGIDHILLGVDHLLFVLGLVLIVPDRFTLFKTITAFTLAHSLTLAAATLGYVSAPVAPIEAAIAMSILFLGPEIVRHQRGETSLTIRRPWLVAFAFGLLHGFGFASGLRTAGLPHGDIPVALLCFNVGVEFGQLGFVALILLLAGSLRVLEIRWPRILALAPGYAVGSLGAYWTFQRAWMLFGGTR